MRYPRLSPAAAVVVGGLLLVAATAACGRWWASRDDVPPALADEVRKRRAELLEELRTVTLSNCEWIRVGGANDAGYAMCGNLLAGIQTAYSYGIGGNDDWGCQISRQHKVPVHQYDCFEPVSAPCRGGDFRLNVECIGPTTETKDGRPFDTLASQIARNGDAGKTMVVKIDIEGAEWQAIIAAPDAIFESIVQMPMELHGTDDAQVLEGLRTLKRHFYLVSVHFNNWECSDKYAPFPSFAYQVLLVNKKIGIPGEPPPGSAPLASALAPDNPRAPECTFPAR